MLGGNPRVVGGDDARDAAAAGSATGDYSVRWSIVSDDGHEEEGVIAFGVGVGREPPLTTLGRADVDHVAARPVADALLHRRARGGSGRRAFVLLVLRPLRLERDLVRPQRRTFSSSGSWCAFVGADALIHGGAADATRFERVIQVAATVSAIGGSGRGADAALPAAALRRVVVRLRAPR